MKYYTPKRQNDSMLIFTKRHFYLSVFSTKRHFSADASLISLMALKFMKSYSFLLHMDQPYLVRLQQYRKEQPAAPIYRVTFKVIFRNSHPL